MATKAKILIISEKLLNETALIGMLKKFKLDITQVNSSKKALEQITSTLFDAILCDIETPKIDAKLLIELCPKQSVIFASQNPNLRQAIEFIQTGAADFIEQPLDLEYLQQVIHKILNSRIPLIGNSVQILNIASKIKQISKRVTPVLIIGESGSGKRKIARQIHQSSPIFNAPLIMIDCATVTEQQLSKELNTNNQKALYYHNICELDRSLQKMVAVSLGNKKIRTIASTEKDLSTATALDLFREDLLFKLSSITINVPPLRERKSDIALLAEHFVNQYAKKLNREISITNKAIKALNDFEWPGNVAQLKKSIYQALICSNSDGILDATSLSLTNIHKPKDLIAEKQAVIADMSLKDYFVHFVTQNQQHMSETELAKNLGISRKSLWQRRIKFKLPRA